MYSEVQVEQVWTCSGEVQGDREGSSVRRRGVGVLYREGSSEDPVHGEPIMWTDRLVANTRLKTLPLPKLFMRTVMNIKEKVYYYLKFLCSWTMNLITVPFLGFLLSTAYSLEINEDNFNKVTSQLRQVSQELQEYKVKFGDVKQKLVKPDCMLRHSCSYSYSCGDNCPGFNFYHVIHATSGSETCGWGWYTV